MIPRLNISFPLKLQWQYWFGSVYKPQQCEFMLNHARSGIVLALRAVLPHGGNIGVVAYNCHTVANAVKVAGCTPIFMDVTEKLTIDIDSIPIDLDVIIVTNLFGIKNDIEKIRTKFPHSIIIVDNAHGYGLPHEGDFTIYSIDQGKFPSIGEGGLLFVNNEKYIDKVCYLYDKLPIYSRMLQLKLFAKMLAKAFLYNRWIYEKFALKLKNRRSVIVNENIICRKMASGVSKMYNFLCMQIDDNIRHQLENAHDIKEFLMNKYNINDVLIGENAFMVVVKSENPTEIIEDFFEKKIEVATHFKHTVEWACQFGYIEGTCPNAEYLVDHLVMIPTYYNILAK